MKEYEHIQIPYAFYTFLLNRKKAKDMISTAKDTPWKGVKVLHRPGDLKVHLNTISGYKGIKIIKGALHYEHSNGSF